MTDLTDLIARLEAASEGSRELDGAIAFTSGWRQRFGGNEDEYEPEWEHLGGHWLAPGQADTRITHREPPDGFQEPPAYTTSLDAALSLVPPEHWWTAGDCKREKHAHVAPEHIDHDGWEGFGATVALALCIAALKARSAA